MNKAIVPIVIFIMLIGGGSFLYSKWHFFQEDSQTFVHDKPTACKDCGETMWHGARAHFCSKQVPVLEQE